jgi:DAK2 domain fusion protein YloV
VADVGEDDQRQHRLERLDALAARRWALTTRAVFAARRGEIDALNVFPVPDGDTGTNLYLTLDAALDAVRGDAGGTGEPATRTSPDLARDADSLARATLLAARGNSGVILSQLVRGLSEVVGQASERGEGVDGRTLARALRRASDLARASVTRPVEGTILSVATEAATAAEQVCTDPDAGLYDVAAAALGAAREALDATTAQLPALTRAGVVDAGAAGYVLVLESLVHVISGAGARGSSHHRHDRHGGPRERGGPGDLAELGRPRWAPSTAVPGDGDGDGEDDGPSYEVMFLLSDSAPAQVETMRHVLDGLGSSLLVVGGPDLWNVHVHVDDVGAALEAGVEAGRPHRIRVTHLAEQRGRRDSDPVTPVAVVACAPGEGLADIFRAAGAGVVRSGPGRRASAGQILDEIRAVHALSVIVLPDDSDTQLAAEAAARAAADEGIEVHVVRARAVVQGVAALAVFDPSAGPAGNLLAMSSAAAATRHGAVTVASRDALTDAGPCHQGDVLGLVDGEIVVVGSDLVQVGVEVLDRLLGSGGELLTVVTGEDAPPGVGGAIAAAAHTRRREVEASVLHGGQATYPLLLGVE